MSIKRHLHELQWRSMIVAGFFIVGAVLAYSYQDQLIPFLLEPLHGEKLVYLTPGGGFTFSLMISVYSGLALALPILVQQLYAFLRPSLPKSAQNKSPGIIIGSFLLLIAGVAFGYLVAVPSALTFLYSFADKYVDASLTAESYLNFIIAYTLGIGMVFLLPLVILLIHSIKPLKPGGLMKSEKWVVLVAFIVAAVITPTPDPVNQAIIAGPVIVIYQIGVIAVLIDIAQKRRRLKIQTKKELRQATKMAKTIRANPSVPTHRPSPKQVAPPRVAHVVAQPPKVTPPAPTLPVVKKAPQAVSIDGFNQIRRQPPQLQVPTRPRAQVVSSQRTQTTRPTNSVRNGFYLDGVSVARRASSY
ncbi:MAG: twin-arginine translocase subunit TatC [Candidatus Microsaccharimonas sp.]